MNNHIKQQPKKNATELAGQRGVVKAAVNATYGGVRNSGTESRK